MFRLASCALALIVVLASAILPACGGICCPKAPDASMHAQMPCCAGESSMAPRDNSATQPATLARAATTIALTTAPATIELAPPRVQPPPRIALATPHEPTPPLFLLNAQFLI